MKYFSHLVSTVVITMFALQTASAESGQIGIVNITQLFNQSVFVQTANKKLQDNVKKMEAQVQAQQKKLQGLAAQYDAMKVVSAKKTALQKQIIDEQTKLTKMAEKFQQQIRVEQNAGMQDYTKLVQIATTKVAQEKHLSGVLSSAAVVYADPTWIDITPDVAKAMPTQP